MPTVDSPVPDVVHLLVRGMVDHRAWDSVSARLTAVSAVRDVELSLVRGLATIRLNSPCSSATLIAAVVAAGCDADVWTGDPPSSIGGPP